MKHGRDRRGRDDRLADRSRIGRSRRTVAGGAVATAIAITIALTGCAGARNVLGTSASVCFKALPGADEAVHRQGHLVGVRLLQADHLQQRLPTPGPLDSVAPKTELCVFAFSGSFTSSQIATATPGQSGSYAVVALTVTRPRVVAAFVIDQLPTRFRHLRA